MDLRPPKSLKSVLDKEKKEKGKEKEKKQHKKKLEWTKRG
jgi:hypothetical protein